MVVAAFTEAEDPMVVAGAASTEGMAAFVEATADTAGAGAVMAWVGADMAGAGADMAGDGGVMADSVIPTSASALVSTPGPIGLDRISATTDIPIIRTMDATIHTALTPVTLMVMTHIPTVRT